MLEKAKIGFVKNHSDKKTRTTTLKELVEMIRKPTAEVADNVKNARIAYGEAGGGKDGKHAAKQFKDKLPCVTISGTGTRKTAETASGLVCADLDELGERLEELRKKLDADPHVATVFRSPSGDGLKAVIRVPVITSGEDTEMRKAHTKNFEAVREYMLKNFEIELDSSTSDLLRLTYLSYDQECRLNPQAAELDVEKWSPPQKEAKPSSTGHGNTGGIPRYDVQALLSSIPAKPPYDEWYRISAAVRNTLEDTPAAIRLLKEWSPEEKPGEYQKLLGTSFEEIKAGTLLHYAHEHGYSGVIKNFFYAGNKGYAMRCGDNYIPLVSDTAVKRHLQSIYRIPKTETNSVICRIQTEQHVQHIGSIAGHKPGLHEFNGDRFLVTKGPHIIEGIKGSSSFVTGFLFRLLLDPEYPAQFISFLAWLSHIRKAVIKGVRVQSPVLALAGDRNDGKSLCIEIIKHCLGGRSQKAFKYLCGEDTFNHELVGAELLVCDDESASSTPNARHKLAQALKSDLFAGSVRARGMHTCAFSCAPVQAVVFATNSDPEHLRALPTFDESMSDKIMLMKTRNSPVPHNISGDQEAIRNLVLKDLPSFLGMLDELDFSHEYDRGRLKCFHHPEILGAINCLAPEFELLAMVRRLPEIQKDIRQGGKWVGTASQLQAMLQSNTSPHRSAANRILTWPTACGTFLGRLANDKSTRVSLGAKNAERIQTYVIK